MGALPLRLQPSTSFDPSSPSIQLPDSSAMSEPATTSASRDVWVDVQTPPSQASATMSAEALQDLVASSVRSAMATALQDVNQTIDGRVQAAILQRTQRQETPPATSSAPGAPVATGSGLSGLPNPASIASVPLMSGLLLSAARLRPVENGMLQHTLSAARLRPVENGMLQHTFFNGSYRFQRVSIWLHSVAACHT